MRLDEINLLEKGEQPKYYFAYGMLTDPKIMQGVKLVGVAELQNFSYEMLQYADVVPDAGSKVYGCLWQVDRKLIAQLDKIEGYPFLYDRKTVPVYLNDVKYPAELYTMTPQTRQQLQGSKPSRKYIKQIVRGYSNAGVPVFQLQQALKNMNNNSNSVVDEARMSPSAFADAVNQGTAKGVLVGFEFEVLVPKATIDLTKQTQNKDITPEYVAEIIHDTDFFDNTDFDDLSVKKFDILFKLKSGSSAKYPNATNAFDALRQNRLERIKKIFMEIPEELRQRYVPQIKNSVMRLRGADSLDKQLTFARQLGHVLYTQHSRKIEEIGYRLRSTAAYFSWEELFQLWFNTTQAKVTKNMAQLFDYDAATVYKELDLQTYRDEYNDDDDYYEHDYDYGGASKVLEPAVSKYFNSKVHVFSSYHQSRKNLTDWYIEPDGSLEPTDGNDGAAEIVSPPMAAAQSMSALKNFYDMAQQLRLYTNASTGLHINVSIPDKIDILKLALFLGDQYVLQQFDRADSDYAQSAERTIKRLAPGKITKKGKIDFRKLQKLAQDSTGFHTASISDNGKYISFRHAGGDYLADYNKIVNTVGRFIRAMLIAADPNAYAQEYQSKLAKITGSTSTSDSSIVTYLRTQGLPVYNISLWRMGRSSIKTVLYNLPMNWRESHWPMYSIQDIKQNNQEAKQNIVNNLRSERLKTQAAEANPDKFVQLMLVPITENAISEITKSVDRGVQVSEDYSRYGYGLIRKDFYPPSHPMTQSVLKNVLRRQLKKK